MYWAERIHHLIAQLDPPAEAALDRFFVSTGIQDHVSVAIVLSCNMDFAFRAISFEGQ